MQFSASIPIYIQVMGDMKRDMVAGALPAGGRVDSVRALAARYGINLNTMQRACAELEREGLLEHKNGYYRLTERGLDLSNYAMSLFLLD